MEIATIGFTQTSAEHFFGRLRAAGVHRLLDVRLHNVSQLAGFAKGQDLAYFVRELLRGTYVHDLRLAPTAEMLSAYRAKMQSWASYETDFLALMEERGVLRILDRAAFETKTALLCSEARPECCHRRLVAELLGEAWGLNVEHL